VRAASSRERSIPSSEMEKVQDVLMSFYLLIEIFLIFFSFG
jgi:hypothetical protein